MNDLIGGVPLVAVIMALVEYLKKMNVSGNWLLLASLIIGTIAGVAYRYSAAPLATFGEWMGAVVYGLAIGLTASGLYDVGKGLVKPE